MALPPCEPPDRFTRHRWHWVMKNAPECWEWAGPIRVPRWKRPSELHWTTPAEAAANGWEYVGEAHPPGHLKAAS